MNLAKRFKIAFILSDSLSIILTWWLFWVVRKIHLEKAILRYDSNFFIGLGVLLVAWLTLYYISGDYYEVLRKYRFKIFARTSIQSIIGSILIFFFVMLDDIASDYTMYYKSFLIYLGFQYGITLTSRMIITQSIINKIKSGEIQFKGLIIGDDSSAVKIYKELLANKGINGLNIFGYLSNSKNQEAISRYLPKVGDLSNINDFITQENISEVILALSKENRNDESRIVTSLLVTPVKILIVPDKYDILTRKMSIPHVYGPRLYAIENEIMPRWQFNVKRILDVFISVLALIITSPILFVIAVSVKLGSKGPIFFTQERIGKNEVPFQIIKFRTMYTDAEKLGPQLSKEGDSRITKTGLFLRKTRLDEFPQFWNVIKGEMSIVGPRPERRFFIDQIKEIEPQFGYLHRIRPGITSWGQVRYGYASNVKQMIQRMKLDLLYVRNMSLSLDFKIMFFTFIIMIKGKGK